MQKNSFTNYEQYQLAYYQTMLQAIEKPDCFLTNKKEMEIYINLYDLWGIASGIEITLGNARRGMQDKP